VTIESVGFMKF